MNLPGAGDAFAATFNATLLGALLIAAHRLRDVRSLRILPWIAVAWFGVVHGGCPCPLGGVAEASRGRDMAPAAAVMFLLPLAFAQLHGRTFCSGACPMGAFQDLFGFRARNRKSKIPATTERRLGLLRWAAFATVAGAAAFAGRNLVCEFDPLPNLYAMRFETGAVAAAAALALGSFFASRPFCRWLCPYAPILETCARLAPVGIEASPACVRCGKCDKVCPMNAVGKGVVHTPSCIRCGRCASVCPKNAILVRDDDSGARSGTPTRQATRDAGSTSISPAAFPPSASSEPSPSRSRITSAAGSADSTRTNSPGVSR